MTLARIFTVVALAAVTGISVACSGAVDEGAKLDAGATCDGQACAADAGGCVLDGVSYQPGAKFRCPDGCNTCWCRADGQIEQTVMACQGCVPPRKPPPGTVCTGEIVYARNPNDGACCMYGSACNAPSSWKAYGSEAECKNAK